MEYGRRYTLALTWVRRHESMVRVLRRMVARIREIGLKIRRVLLDRAFFNGAVVAFLQEEKLPFVMPVVIRGRAPKKGTKPTGLRWIKRQPAGWYPHAMKHEKQPLKISVCVGYRRHRNRKDGKQRHQKLLFAAWRVHGSPTEIRELYRLRFGIETSFRQMRQATNLHLHAQSSPAAVLSGRGVDSAEPLGVDSSDSPCRRIGRHPDTASGTAAIQTHARLDRPRNRRPISRRLNTLRRSAAVNQTWNYMTILLWGGHFAKDKVPPIPEKVVSAGREVTSWGRNPSRPGCLSAVRPDGSRERLGAWLAPGHGFLGLHVALRRCPGQATYHHPGQAFGRSLPSDCRRSPVGNLDEADATVIQGASQNRYDENSKTLELTPAQAYAFQQMRKFWDKEFSEGDSHYGFLKDTIPTWRLNGKT